MHELELGMLASRLADHDGADVHADAVVRLERGEEVAAAAADLEDAEAGRHVEAIGGTKQRVIGAIPPCPPRFVRRETVEERADAGV